MLVERDADGQGSLESPLLDLVAGREEHSLHQPVHRSTGYRSLWIFANVPLHLPQGTVSESELVSFVARPVSITRLDLVEQGELLGDGLDEGITGLASLLAYLAVDVLAKDALAPIRRSLDSELAACLPLTGTWMGITIPRLRDWRGEEVTLPAELVESVILQEGVDWTAGIALVCCPVQPCIQRRLPYEGGASSYERSGRDG